LTKLADPTELPERTYCAELPDLAKSTALAELANGSELAELAESAELTEGADLDRGGWELGGGADRAQPPGVPELTDSAPLAELVEGSRELDGGADRAQPPGLAAEFRVGGQGEQADGRGQGQAVAGLRQTQCRRHEAIPNGRPQKFPVRQQAGRHSLGTNAPL